MQRFSVLIGVLSVLALVASGCADAPTAAPDAPDPGVVHQVQAKVQTNANGTTVEQENVARRLVEDNKPGAIKFLYVISPYTGDVLLYAAVKGKVTSSGKRLKPLNEDMEFQPGGYDTAAHYMREALGDDGTYGDSVQYLYFWGVDGTYRQIYVGGAIVVISSQPIRTKKAVINLSVEK